MAWLIRSYQLLSLQLLLLYSQSFAKLCSHDQSNVLLQFKQLFSFRNISSSYCHEHNVPSYPKMVSWEENIDCCSWNGVTCDKETGHVIGLDLSCSWLHGNIPSNSSLFLLPHLQKLNLAYNDFNYSQISSSFNHFVDLTLLNLSSSGFHGQLPVEISHLSKLVSLDLSYNLLLTVEKPFLEGMVQNLTKLKELFLDYVDMSTIVPSSLTNLSSPLTSLSLTSCGLRGNFPDSIFRQPNLEILSLASNFNLTGLFPKVNWSSPLTFLDLWNTSLSGELPDTLSNLVALMYLDLFNCNFFGPVPASLGNLTQLTYLNLAANNFSGHIPSSLSNLEKLNFLHLSSNKFMGEIPDIFVNLTQLSFLSFQCNQLAGPIPSHASGLQNLVHFTVFDNLLNGPIPSWLFTLPRLELIDLGYNQLTGRIVEFQSNLLRYLYLDSNWLTGSLPVLPPQLKEFLISNNNLMGRIPHLICNMSFIEILDLYNNNLYGEIPECIGNLSNSLQVLDLQKNRFYGRIPNTFGKGNHLRTLNFNGNELEGLVPRSLVNCSVLEVLDLGNNNINDIFPYWLGSLRNLQVLVLRSNKFYGFVWDSFKTHHSFAKLRIFDLSSNNFTGPLPENYLANLKAMMNIGEKAERTLQYMGDGYYKDSVKITLKGNEVELIKIPPTFTSIDFSNNKFNGRIVEVIGTLHALRSLNLSKNSLIGCIPPSFENLTALESLDLSSNKLVGEIPWQLTNLNFLQILNLSQNQLIGPIPRATHFDTFPDNSYSGNLGLCGFPLSNLCDSNDKKPQPFSIPEDDSESRNGFGWKVVLAGYGCGMVFGMIIGCLVFSTRKTRWLLYIVEGKHCRKVRRSSIKRGGRRLG